MTPSLPLFLGVYLLAINAAAFLAFGVDKGRARRDQWRIPERTLLGFSAAGGFVGAFLGMKVFHHKTRKTKFTLGVPLSAAVWIAAGVLLLRFG
jgi:uncharacterized membrane protein YsdA (DUF1294 family)